MEEIFKSLPFRVYNSEQPNHPSKIFGGKASGIRNWDKLKYPIFLDYQRKLFGEFWIPEETKLGKDMEQYKQLLSDEEQLVFQYNSGALNWLDSIATDVVTFLFMTTSDPSLRTLWSIISAFESMHNVSYEHIASSVMNSNEKEKAFEDIKKLPLMQKRNQPIIDKLQKMIDTLCTYLVRNYLKQRKGDGNLNKELDSIYPLIVRDDNEFTQQELQDIFEGLIAYQVLEGLYFTGGFVYFHSLARDNKMIETNNIIAMIRADENQHSEVFGTVIQAFMNDFPELNTQENLNSAVNFIRDSVELEKEWSTWLFEDIDTLSISEYHDYIEHLANLICRNAGMQEPYPDNEGNKATWVSTYGSKKKGSDGLAVKADFLQSDAIDYTHEDGGDFDL